MAGRGQKSELRCFTQILQYSSKLHTVFPKTGDDIVHIKSLNANMDSRVVTEQFQTLRLHRSARAIRINVNNKNKWRQEDSNRVRKLQSTSFAGVRVECFVQLGKSIFTWKRLRWLESDSRSKNVCSVSPGFTPNCSSSEPGNELLPLIRGGEGAVETEGAADHPADSVGSGA